MDHRSRFTALASVTNSFSKFAGAVIGITAVLYVLGYITWLAYFGSVKASWAFELLSTTQVLHAGTPAFLVFATAAAFAIAWVMAHSNVPRGIAWIALAGTLVAGFLGYMGGFPSLAPTADRPWALMASSIAYGVSAGLAVAAIVAELARDRPIVRNIVLSVLFLLFGLTYAPLFMGRYMAVSRSYADLSSYPTASLKEPDGKQWHVFLPVSDKALLIRAEGKDTNKFRVVDFTAISEITPPEQD